MLLTLLALGCAPCLLERTGRSCEDWPPVEETGGEETADTAPPEPKVLSTDLGGGVTETWVDATAYLEFVYLSLETGEEVAVTDPLAQTDWDLGFERYLAPSNGGVSGPGGLEAVALEGEDFDALSQAPAEGYVSDAADDEDENDTPEYALGEWFDYTTENHTLTPRDVVYVLHVRDLYYKLRFVDYYDEAGSPAYITLHWAVISGP